jgi:ABC-2 type transport system permease protein
MRLGALYVRTSTLELVRYPAYSIPTIAFPTLIFSVASASLESGEPEVLMGAFVIVAVLGVAFFQFGVGISLERSSPWESYVRTLPVTVRLRLAARVASALLFASFSASLVVLVAVATTSTSLAPQEWLSFSAAALLGGIPFALLGIALGYLVPPRAALPIANLVFLPLAYLGGLWGGPDKLPDELAGISRFMPTRQWGDIVWAAVAGERWPLASVAGLAAYTAAFRVRRPRGVGLPARRGGAVLVTLTRHPAATPRSPPERPAADSPSRPVARRPRSPRFPARPPAHRGRAGD